MRPIPAGTNLENLCESGILGVSSRESRGYPVGLSLHLNGETFHGVNKFQPRVAKSPKHGSQSRGTRVVGSTISHSRT